MKLLMQLAWRNVWRNWRRTFLTIAAIAFASTVLTFFMGIQLKSYDTAVTTSVSLFQGALQIQAPEYLEKPRMRTSFKLTANVREYLKRSADTLSFSERANGFALASTGERSFGVQVIGVEPQREPGVSTMSSKIISGRYLVSGNEAVLGEALAKNLKLSIGSELTLLGQGRDGSLAATVVSLVGIFKTGARELDRNLVEMPLENFNQAFSMEDELHAVVIALKDFSTITPVSTELNQLLIKEYQGSVQLRSWEELLPGVKQSIQLDMAGASLFYSSLVIIVGFSILNTFLMSVLERTREFGTIMALGSSPLKLAILVFIECLLLTLCGVVLGLLFGSTIVQYFHLQGFSVPGTEEIMKQWNLPGVVYPELSLKVLLLPPLVVMTSAALSVIYPLFRVLSLKELPALRG